MYTEYGKEIIIPKVKEEDIDFFRWFGGFFDGEGCFSVGIKKYTGNKVKKSILNFQLLPVVQISQSEDNSNYLYEIERILSKYVDSFKVRQYKRRALNNNQKDVMNMVVSNLSGCIVLSSIIEPYLHVKKETCNKYLEICYMMKNHQHLTYEGFINICVKRKDLNKRAKNDNYHDLDKIKEELVVREEKHTKRPLSNTEKSILKDMYSNNEPLEKIAEVFGKKPSTMLDYIRKNKIKRNKGHDNKKGNNN